MHTSHEKSTMRDEIAANPKMNIQEDRNNRPKKYDELADLRKYISDLE